MKSPILSLKSQLNKYKKLDGFFSLKKENIHWLTRFQGSFGMYIQTIKQNYLITDNRYAERAEKLAMENDCEFVLYDKDFKENFGQKLTGIFGIEDSITLSQLSWLRKTFPSLRFRSQRKIIEKLRRNKTEAEINKIKTAQNHIDTILIPLLKAKLKTGVTEKEIAFELEHLIRDKGKYDISFEAIVAFGENSSIAHHSSSERKLKKGDNILIDCGANYKGFCSDMTRNFGFGNVSEEYQKKYALLLEVQTKILAEYRVRKSTKSVDQHCRKHLQAEVKYFTHSLGHGVGLEIHELPNLSPKSNFILQENDVVTCEPGLYYQGSFGIRIEDLVIIRKAGPEILSNTSKKLIIF